MIAENGITLIKPKAAVRITTVLGLISVSLAILYTFFDQNYLGALVGISSASAFYYLYRNPKMMMAKSWDEFGKLYDSSRDKKYLWGFPAYHAVMLLVILYIWLV